MHNPLSLCRGTSNLETIIVTSKETDMRIWICIIQRTNKQVFIKASGISLILAITFFVNSCIVPFDAETDEEYDLVSIEGSLIKGKEEHKITISRTTSLDEQKFKPITGCDISLIDNLENQYYYFENLDGTYSLKIDDDLLVFNRQYKIRIITPDGKRYESQSELLIRGAEVDSVYYRMEDKYDKITNKNLFGVQFYVDLKAADSLSSYYRWNLEETYEITSIAPISYYYTGDENQPIARPETSIEFYRCWKTAKVRELFLSNTINLLVNEKKQIPLSLVSTETDRLKIKYSLLVSQYALSEGAYNYWSKLRNETQSAGGLYTQQPGKPVSNITNIDDSNEIVLGYFWVSHSTSKRIFVPGISSIKITGYNCELFEYDPSRPGRRTYPLYIYLDPNMGLEMTASNECFNCTFRGGKTSPPDFWE